MRWTTLTEVFSIHHAPRPTSNTPVIIYLTGPAPVEPSTLPPLPALALASNATVVCIHYRLSTEQSYPTPVHDVLAGFDWVQKHLARVNVEIDHAEHPVETASIGVCGELVSGSLATMLALTECRPTKGGVKAAAVGNAIVDWTSLFPAGENGTPPAVSYREDREATTSPNARHVAPERSPNQHGPSLSNDGLLQLRSRLFTRPEKYFDPFASPLLFFRTPGSELASPVDDIHARQAFDHHDGIAAHDGSLAQTKRRRSSRKYPPSGSGLRLPYMRFEAGIQSNLREQGEEMVDVLNKSAKHWEEESYGALDRDAASKRVRLVERSGLGLWGESELRELGNWFGDVLRR